TCWSAVVRSWLIPSGTAAAYSVILHPASNFLDGALRAGRYTFTGAAVGAVFGLTSCITAQVRQKPDDPLNYFLGGCAGGLTMGSRGEASAQHVGAGSHCVVQAGLKLLALTIPPSSASQRAGIIGMSHCPRPPCMETAQMSTCVPAQAGPHNSSGSLPPAGLGAWAWGRHTHHKPGGAGALSEPLKQALGSNPTT
uniref:NADH dehydrogenase [ubiquinone] 1 alpha subcomplex subunit 11 n=1 Tax=Cebus imitator TaxID=2715852 RepID=A0A2K5RSJ5_CEBIM